MKTGRAVGVDDGYFRRGVDRRAPLVFTIMKGPVVEGFRFSWIEVDGTDTTEKILEVLSPLKDQIGVVFLYGTIFGGTNVVSLPWLFRETKRPVIAVADEPPRDEEILTALSRWGQNESVERYRENPPMNVVETKKGTLWIAVQGATIKEAVDAIESYQISSKIPEPLRISHLIGKEVGRWI